MIFEVHVTYVSGQDAFQENREESMLWDFFNEYERRRSESSSAAVAALLSLEDAVEIAHFHSSVIEPLTQRYAIWALASLSSSPEAQPLSETETRRIQRGLYLLQLFCNACCSTGKGGSASRGNRPGVVPRIRDNLGRLRVLSLFPAWQVEEMLCVHEFTKDTYGGVFHRVAWDLNEERNPKYSHISTVDAKEDLLLLDDTTEGMLSPRRLSASVVLATPLTRGP
ncbi:hypothetical protein VTK26DRAFT_7950 [Humicola hyalothermophila]